MAHASCENFERESCRVSPDSASGMAWRHWRRSLHEPVDRVLLSLFIALQLADIASTNRALAFSGNHEANPLMASLQAHLGAAWWVPKAAAMTLVCLAAPLTGRRWPMMFAVCFYLLVVAGNLTAR